MHIVPIFIEGFFAFLLLLWLIPSFVYDKIWDNILEYKAHKIFKPEWRTILTEKVRFYRNLSPRKKKEFEKRLTEFLINYRIKGVELPLTDLDKILVAASGIIPVFAFPTWYYKDLKTIYLFPDAFTFKHPLIPEGTKVNGLVGYGQMKDKMYLSLKALTESFEKDQDQQNTGIHEFLHLIDMEDEQADGIPESLMHQTYIKPWRELIKKEIERVCQDDSILNDYACQNAAEFFAESGVAFFENPKILQEKHPELYQMLVRIFMQKPS